jgi:hypothetical protein
MFTSGYTDIGLTAPDTGDPVVTTNYNTKTLSNYK